MRRYFSMECVISSIVDLHKNILSKQIFGFSSCDDCDSCSSDPYCDGCSGECGCDDCGSSETLCSSYDYPDQCGSGDDCDSY